MMLRCSMLTCYIPVSIMLLDRLVYHVYPVSRVGIRMLSTIVGKHGRSYVQREVLQERKDSRRNVYKAEYV